MATKTESTAHAAATANQEEVWDKIMQYKAAVQILKTLLAERKITEEDYRRVHAAARTDGNGAFRLFPYSLTLVRSYGNMSSERGRLSRHE